MSRLAAALRAGGHKVIETREPGGTPTAEKIRKILLDSGTVSLAPLAEMALMFASRAQHIAEVIEPGLAAGSIVLCDRFTDSTEAYQGSGRKLGSDAVRELHRVLCGNLQPDLTLLLDSNPHASVSRARRRNKRNAKGASRHDEKPITKSAIAAIPFMTSTLATVSDVNHHDSWHWPTGFRPTQRNYCYQTWVLKNSVFLKTAKIRGIENV